MRRALVDGRFDSMAEREAVIAIREPSRRNPKSGAQWRASLQTCVYPSLGALPVSELTPGRVMAVLEPIWNEKRETTRRVKQRISAICRWAVAQGHRTDEPASVATDTALPRNEVKIMRILRLRWFC